VIVDVLRLEVKFLFEINNLLYSYFMDKVENQSMMNDYNTKEVASARNSRPIVHNSLSEFMNNKRVINAFLNSETMICLGDY